MNTRKTSKINWFDKQADSFEQYRFSMMTIMMTAQSCWGSIAAMFMLKTENLTLLAICAAFTLASNSAFIGQASAKWCLIIFYASVLTNLFILVYGILNVI